MPNEFDSPALRAAIAVLGAAITALGPPPPSVRTARDLEAWVTAWVDSLRPLGKDDIVVVSASAEATLEQLQPDDDAVAQLAQIWKDSLGSITRRLEVIEDPNAPDVASGLAADPLVNALSVWTRRASRKKPVLWRWPIDIAALSAAGGGAISADLSTLLINKRYLEPLVEFTEDRAVAADMLLLRGTPAESLRATSPRAHAPRAGLVLMQSEAPVATQEVTKAVHELGRRFPGSAVAWAPVPGPLFQPWIEEMVRELSHNEPLDVAMFKAAKLGHPGTPPILVAPRGFMESSRLSRSIDRLERRLRSTAVRAQPMTIPSGGRAADVLATSGEMTAGEVGKWLGRVPRDVGFAEERGLATASVEISATAPPAPVHRFLQARVVEADDGTSKRTTWLAGTPNRVEARIGVEAPEWPTPRGAVPFPVEEVLGEEDEIDVDVFCYVIGAGDRPMRSRITVRRSRDSSICRFEVAVAQDIKEFVVRIIVMHGGRVIQAGTLAGNVRQTPKEGIAPAEFKLEALVRSNISSFRNMQRSDGSIFVAPGSTEVFDGVKGFKAPAILSALLQTYDTKLSDVAKNPDLYAALDSDASLKLIRELAQVGSEVRDELADAGLSGNVLKGKRLQVVEVKNGIRVPVELFYDGDGPLPDATLCRNWRIGLLQGQCAVDCPANEGGDTQICPRRFWGLSRVIERHLESSGDPDWDGDFGIRAEPGERSELKLFRATAVAGSSRVTKHVPKGLAELRAQLELNDGVADHHRLAGNWTDWEQAIRDGAPSLLLLLPHTRMQGIQPELEIGDDLKLISNIKSEHIGAVENKPVVVLLGCETDTDPTNFFSIVGRCRRRGAVIVIAFGATIAVKHAVPAAKELLQQLVAAASAKPSALLLGDAMLATRRALVAAGWIAALGLTAYGDGDWKFVS